MKFIIDAQLPRSLKKSNFEQGESISITKSKSELFVRSLCSILITKVLER